MDGRAGNTIAWLSTTLLSPRHSWWIAMSPRSAGTALRWTMFLVGLLAICGMGAFLSSSALTLSHHMMLADIGVLPFLVLGFAAICAAISLYGFVMMTIAFIVSFRHF